jgi:hypothetical protein
MQLPPCARTACPRRKRRRCRPPDSARCKRWRGGRSRSISVVAVFLARPFDFFAYQDSNYLVGSSTALGDVWFSTKISAGQDSQYGQHTFAYDWYNDNESSVLLSVFTALVFFGSLYGGASGAGANALWDARTECDVNATLKLSVGNDLDPEYRTSTIATFVIDTGLFGLGLLDRNGSIMRIAGSPWTATLSRRTPESRSM